MSEKLTLTYTGVRPAARAVLLAEVSGKLRALAEGGTIANDYSISLPPDTTASEQLTRFVKISRRILDGDTHMVHDEDWAFYEGFIAGVLGQR